MPPIPNPPDAADTSDLDSASAAQPAEVVVDDVAPPVLEVETPKGRRRGLILVVALVIVLVGALATGTWLFMQLTDARQQIDEQNNQIDDQRNQIHEQQEQIDKKDSFRAAMASLQKAIAPLAGLPFAGLVPWSDYDEIAADAWAQRRDLAAMDRDIDAVHAATTKIVDMQEAARVQASSNASGSAWEGTLDQLGRGWVTTSLEGVLVSCGSEALACVISTDPFVVHVNAASGPDGSMTDWIRRGVAYHEFAHVLQYLNPDATNKALPAFNGDWETMADCYALTMLPGWSLEHTVWINAYEYWDVNVGYGYTCNESQRQTIRDWNSQLGIVTRSIGG